MPPVLHVLCGEHDPGEAESLRAHFATAAPDIALETVSHARDLLPLARARRHALLMVEHRLPGLDGFEIKRLLAEEGIDTPVIFLAEVTDGEAGLPALRTGVDDFVIKREGYRAGLPARLRAAVERRAARAHARPRGASPRHVLLVEDRANESAAIVQELAKEAPMLAVEVAENASDALAVLRSRPRMDLVLCGIRPSGPDAAAFVAAARADAWEGPVILYGPSADEASMNQAFRSGVADFAFRRPGSAGELALRIDLAIAHHELALANERAAAELNERQRTLGALRESEKQLGLALEAGRIGLWSWQVGTGVTQFSSRWKAQIGYSDEEIQNHSNEWESRCHPDDLVRLKMMLARYLAVPWPDFSVEYRMKHKDGAWRSFLLHADLELDEEGRPVRMLGSQIDVTALKQQQAELTSTSGRLQQLSRRLLEVQELERRHLARELHDEIGQVLTVAKIHLQSAALAPQAVSMAGQIHEPIVLLDRLLAQVRSLSLNLRPPLLDDLGLVPALHWLLQQPQPRGSAPRVHLSTDPSLRRFDPTLETACFRIAQEALTNALRHARARTVTVSLGAADGKLRLGVRDDGTGFDAAAARNRSEAGASLGLLGMHERALLAGGTLTLLSAPGRGTEVEAVFPLSNPPESL